MEISEAIEVLSALNSETRLRLMIILREEPLSTKEVREVFNERYNEDLRRESVYRALEKLRDAKLIEREYDDNDGCFKYSIMSKHVAINFDELKDL